MNLPQALRLLESLDELPYPYRMSFGYAWHSRIVLALSLVAAALLSGCGNTTGCALNGDNLKGHISFASGVPILSNANIVVEWSRDSFSTVAGRSTSNKNVQSLIVVPYSLCVDSGVDIQLRAYEDTNDNNTPEAGEPSGRYDQTSNGNAAFVSVQVPAATAAASGSTTTTTSTWPVKEGVDFVIDTP